MALADRLQRFSNKTWIAEVLSLIAGIVYFIQSWHYAHTRESILDEGAYLYKGFLFVTGQFTIFQDYGPWSNHMPLSFYIPGFAQLLFGPGLRTGRYLAILLGLLTLMGLWILIRRVGGRWWAALAVWVIVINPVLIKMYSVMVSQVLIACMLVWTLVLVLGEDRPLWQIGLGGFLAGAMMMTRINLTPVLPLLVLYTFWQHGRKAGWVTILTGGLTVLIGHAFFWPGILRMWGYWLPETLTPFLDPWRPPADAIPSWDPEIGAAGRLSSFFLSFRVSFVALVGAVTTWFLWSPKNQWGKPGDRRSAVFLSSILLVLMLAHMWATLGKNYCVYCLPGYTTFFAVSGITLVIISFASWRKHVPFWQLPLIITFVLVLSTGIGYGATEDLGKPLFDLEFPKFFLGYSLSSGTVPTGELIATIYQLEAKEVRRILPAISGFIAGLFTLFIALIIHIGTTGFRKRKQPAYGYWALLTFLVVGLLLSPTLPLGGGYQFYECSGDVIQSYERAGEFLASKIPPGSRVYWSGSLSAVPLLYVPDIIIYPPQINNGYTFYSSQESDKLAQYGFWNEELAQKWANETDYILIQQRSYKGWLVDVVNSGDFDELESSPPTVACLKGAQIRIFRRKP